VDKTNHSAFIKQTIQDSIDLKTRLLHPADLNGHILCEIVESNLFTRL